MKKTLIVAITAFAFGLLLMFLFEEKRIQTTNHYKNALLLNMIGVQELDAQRITLDNDSFLKLFSCVSFESTCHSQEIIADIKKNSMQVGNINEQKQMLMDQVKKINEEFKKDEFWYVK